jgi:uncharacterized protein
LVIAINREVATNEDNHHWRYGTDEHELVVLSRSPDRPPQLPASARVVVWDSETGDGWHNELKDTDAIVNLAGANISGGRWTKSQKQKIRRSRINAGFAIVDGVKKADVAPPRLIQASGISFYGNRKNAYVDESSPKGEGFLPDVCVEWERSTQELEDLGVKRAVIRNGVVLNLTAGALLPMIMPFHLYAGGRMGPGDQGLSWIHIDDEVEAIRYLLEHQNVTGPVNMCSPEPVSYRELADTLAKVTNRPSLIPMPGAILRVLLGEVADTVLHGQFAIPTKLTEAGYRFKYPGIEDALRNLLDQPDAPSRLQQIRRGASAAVQMFLP